MVWALLMSAERAVGVSIPLFELRCSPPRAVAVEMWGAVGAVHMVGVKASRAGTLEGYLAAPLSRALHQHKVLPAESTKYDAELASGQASPWFHIVLQTERVSSCTKMRNKNCLKERSDPGRE